MQRTSDTSINLPNEILGQIFLFVVSRALGEYSSSELDISHVSSRWRSIAITLPPLWSSICVLAYEDPESDGVRSLTELYLERSGNAPLDIFLDVSGADSLVCRLWLHAHRWRSVHLIPFEHNNFLDTRDEFPILESLSLSSAEFPALPGGCPFIIWPSYVAPYLQTLSIDMMLYTLDQLMLPWHQILHLTMSNLDVNQMHNALRLCNKVVTATFLHCANDFSYREPLEYVSRDLSELVIAADRPCETLGPDITHCAYPALTKLKIISGSQEFSFSHGIIPSITSLIIRSNSQSLLSSLTLHGISYNSKQFLQLLQAVSPSLARLDLCDVDHRGWNFLQMESWLIKAMIWDATPANALSGLNTKIYTVPGHLLPHLREFGIRFPGVRREIPLDREKIGILLKMIESRCFTVSSTVQSETSAGKVLEKLHLGRLWSARMPSDFQQRLQILETGGLKITAW